MGEKHIKQELYNYEIEFDGDEPLDVKEVQAAALIRDVLFVLEVPHQNITIKKVVESIFEAEEGGCTITFAGEEPEYWTAEANLEEKAIRISINEYKMTIPLATILMWFRDAKESNL